MDPIRRKLVFALASGLAAALLAFLYLNFQEKSLLHRASEREVLAASRYIPAYTRLDESYFSLRSIPAEYLPKGTVSDPADVKGLTTLAPFSSGEPLLFNKLARSSQSLAAALPEGKRAFSLAVDPVTGLSGLLRPGDAVDVLLLTEGENGKAQAMAATLLQAVRVVAVGTQYSGDEKNGDQPATVTLALSPSDCEILLFAQSRGRVQLTLRPPDDRATVDLKTANFSQVLSRLGQARGARGATVEIIRGKEKENVEVQ